MTGAAKQYGGSLFELAAEEGLDSQILQQLQVASDCISGQPAYLRLLSTPSLTRAVRRSLLEEAFAPQMHAYTVNFLKLLCDQGLLRQLPACLKEYRTRYNQAHGIVQVQVAAAMPLDPDLQQRLTQKLAALTGKQIDLTVQVEPDLLGGIRLDMEGVRLDGTLRRRLDTLREALSRLTL